VRLRPIRIALAFQDFAGLPCEPGADYDAVRGRSICIGSAACQNQWGFLVLQQPPQGGLIEFLRAY